MLIVKTRETEQERERKAGSELRLNNVLQSELYGKKVWVIVSIIREFEHKIDKNPGGFRMSHGFKKQRGGSYPSILKIPKNKGRGS